MTTTKTTSRRSEGRDVKDASESDVLGSCLRLLSLRGVFAWRQNQGAIPLPGGGYRKFVGLKGVSDILGVLPPYGRLLAVEVKRPGGRMTTDQRMFQAAVNDLGGLAVCVEAVDELDRILSEVLP